MRGPHVPVGYAQNARVIADRRIVIAGYRLAQWLRSQWGLSAP
jgi:hypothetical protein